MGHRRVVAAIAGALLIVVGLPLLAASPASAVLTCTKNWVGAPGANIANTVNWSPNSAIVATDVLCAPVGSSPLLSASNLPTVSGVILLGSLTINSPRALTVTSADSSTVNNLTLPSGARLAGNVTLTGTASLAGGLGTNASTGDGAVTTIASGATATVASGASIDVYRNHELRNQGLLTISGIVYLWEQSGTAASSLRNEGTLLANAPSFTTWLQWNAAAANATNAPAFTNAPGGTVNVAAGLGGTLYTANGEIAFENDGAYNVTSGTSSVVVPVPVGAVESGTWSTSASAILDWGSGANRAPTTGASISNAGQLTMASPVVLGAPLTFPGAVLINGATVEGPATFTGAVSISGAYFGKNIAAGDGATTTFSSTAAVTSTGGVFVHTNHTLVNQGTWNDTTGSLYLFEEIGTPAAAVLRNEGAINLSGSSRTWAQWTSYSGDEPTTVGRIDNVLGGTIALSPNVGQTIYLADGTIELDNDGAIGSTTSGGFGQINGPSPAGDPDTGAYQVSAGATLTVNANRSYGVGATFVNFGTVSLAGLQTATTPLTIPGTVQLNTPRFVGNVTLTGTVTTPGGIEVGETTGATSGTLTFSPTSSVTISNSVYVYGGSDVVTQGTTTIPSPAYVYLADEDVVGPGDWTNSGTFTVSGNSSRTWLIRTWWVAENVAADPLFLNTPAGTVISAGTASAILSTDTVLDFTNQGTFRVLAGGTATLPSGVLTNLNAGVLTGGTYDIIGTLEIGGDITTNAATVIMTGLIRNAGVNAVKLGTNSGSFTQKRALSTGANLVNTGTYTIDGAFVLTTTNKYTQNAGGSTVITNATGQITAAGGITINGGSVSGIGRLNGAVTHNGGTIAPGMSPGTLTALSTYGGSNGSRLLTEIDGPTVGTQYDRLAVTGAATVDGTLVIDKDPVYAPVNGTTFTVVTGVTRAGTFDNVLGGGLPPTQAFDVIYTATGVNLVVAAASGADQADLSTTLSASTALTGTGTNVTYTLGVTNAGPQRATGVAGTLALPAGTMFVSASDPGCSESGGTVTCPIGQLSNGASWSTTITVNMGAGERSTTATSGVAYFTTDPNLANNAAPATVVVSDGNVFLGVDLSAGSPDPVGVSQPLDMTVTADNTAPIAATGTEVEITIAGGYVGATPTSGSCAYSAPVITCTIGTLAPGATWSADLDLISPASVGGGEFAILASISANEPDPETADDTDLTNTAIEAPGTLDVDDVTVTEGDAGSTNATFTITRSGSTASPASVQVATSDGTATTAGGDYSGVSATVNFANGESSKTVNVPVNGDLLDEADETFNVALSSPANGVLGDATGVGTITDNDPLPTVSVNDVSMAEGNAGTSNVTFTVSLSAASGRSVTVDWATGNTTATAGSDYVSGSGTATFPAGTTSQTFDVVINGDVLFEANETYSVTLSNPSKVTISDGSGLGTVTNDDTAPSASIDDVSITEGNAGTTNATFTVSLSAVSGLDVTVAWGTSNGTAVAPGDYTTASGTATILAGATSTTVTVPVAGDLLDEVNETATVTLSAPTNATINDGSGTLTITDDDAAPTVSVANVTVSEGVGNASVTVSLSAVSGQTVTVGWSTTNGTAVAPGDYTASSGTATITAGSLSTTINVPIIDDAVTEIAETLTVNLASPTNATIGTGTATVTINDNDLALPTLTAGDFASGENTGSPGFRTFQMPVTISAVTGAPVTFDYAVTVGTASGTTDFLPVSGSSSIPSGSTQVKIPVIVVSDALDEVDETFNVTISNVVGAVVADGASVGTIQDDDAPVTVKVSDVTSVEGTSGATTFTFFATLNRDSGKTATVDYATAAIKATAGVDYTTASGTLTFLPGSTSQAFSVTVAADALDEYDETFSVTLTAPTNATIADAVGYGIVKDDPADLPPTISVLDDTVFEGTGGTARVRPKLQLSAPSGKIVKVPYSTFDITAVAPGDYTSASGIANIAAGTTLVTIAPLLTTDGTPEPNEQMGLLIYSVTGASIADAIGVGTINNDD